MRQPFVSLFFFIMAGELMFFQKLPVDICLYFIDQNGVPWASQVAGVTRKARLSSSTFSLKVPV